MQARPRLLHSDLTNIAFSLVRICGNDAAEKLGMDANLIELASTDSAPLQSTVDAVIAELGAAARDAADASKACVGFPGSIKCCDTRVGADHSSIFSPDTRCGLNVGKLCVSSLKYPYIPDQVAGGTNVCWTTAACCPSKSNRNYK